MQAASFRAVRGETHCLHCRGTGRATCSACQGAGIVQREPVRMNQVKHAGALGLHARWAERQLGLVTTFRTPPQQRPAPPTSWVLQVGSVLPAARGRCAPAAPLLGCQAVPSRASCPSLAPALAVGKVQVLLGMNDAKMFDSDWMKSNRCGAGCAPGAGGGAGCWQCLAAPAWVQAAFIPS